MAGDEKLPFESFSFTLVENRMPRRALRMSANGEGEYALSVTRSSAANPISQFTRTVPRETAERLHGRLSAIGVFGWEETYGDETAPGMRKWGIRTVFQEGVFSLESRGGSDVPARFEELLDELYRLDFPRPTGASSGGMTAGSPGASATSGLGVDFSRITDLLGGGTSGMNPELSRMLSELGSNPQSLERQMKEEFGRLSHAEQEQLLDALAATGTASRAWWERFLRG